MCRTAEEIFGKVEKDILDRAHQHLNLLFRNEEDAIAALFHCYAKILRDLRTGRITKPNDNARFQTANEGLRGLGHCLRWIRDCCPTALVVPAPQSNQALNEALELLRWGVEYDPLFGEHSAYRGKLVEVDVDESTKTITFQPGGNVSPRFFCSQIEAKKTDDQRSANECPEEPLAQLSKSWFDSMQPSSRGLHFDDTAISRGGAIEVAAEWMGRTFLPELPATTRLAGCTIADVRRVLASLYVYSLFVTRLEDTSDNHPVTSFALEPRVVSGSKDEITRWLSNLSGVTETNVDAIVSTLTFAHDHPHVTLAQQPFASSRDGQMFLLPRMVMAVSLGLPRMYVSALNSTMDGRQVYSNVINEIETNGVRALTDDLRQRVPNGFQVAERRTFFLANGYNPITPDIVILGSKNEVLVIDVKYATPPFGPLDVRRDLDEMEKWKRRMSEYVTTFQQHSDILAQHFCWTAGTRATVFGLILLRWPFPVPVEFQETIGAVDWPSLQSHLEDTPLDSIAELMSWVHERPDLPVPAVLKWTQRLVKAGGWTYRYFVLSPSPH